MLQIINFQPLTILLTFVPLEQSPNQAMFIAGVKWFDNDKGFGVLALPLGEELFVHIRAFRPSPNESIEPGQVIACGKKHDPKRDSYYAHNCHVLKHPQDWKFVISLLGKTDTVHLGGRQRKGQQHSLMELAAKQLLKGKDEDSIFNMVTFDSDSKVEPSLFIQYAEFLEKNFVRALAKESFDRLLSRIFGHFGNRITSDTLFRVWKVSKFRYIGYDRPGDYEIPEEVLNVNATEIGYEELARIRKYSFGQAFCSGFVNALLDGVETMDREEIDGLIPYLDFLENDDREYWEDTLK